MGAPYHGATPVRWCNNLPPVAKVISLTDIKACSDRGFVPDNYPEAHPLTAVVPDGHYENYEAVNPSPPLPPPSGSFDAKMQSTFYNGTGSEIPGALAPKEKFVPHEKPAIDPRVYPLAARTGVVSEVAPPLRLRDRDTTAKSALQAGLAEKSSAHNEEPSYSRDRRAAGVFTLAVRGSGPPTYKVGVGTAWRRAPKGAEKKGEAVSKGVWKLAKAAFEVTEAIDLLEAVHDALPEDCQNPATPQSMALALVTCFDRLDVNQAVKNVIYNQIEDAIVGYLGRGAGDVLESFGAIRGQGGIAL